MWLIQFLSGKIPFVVQLVAQATFLVAIVPETNGINVLGVLGSGGGQFQRICGCILEGTMRSNNHRCFNSNNKQLPTNHVS